MKHETGDIRRFAESGIADDFEIREAGDTERFTDAMAAGFLNVAKEFGGIREAKTGEEREDAGAGVLRLRREAVGSAVRRMKTGMPLRDEIGLAGEPDTVQF